MEKSDQKSAVFGDPETTPACTLDPCSAIISEHSNPWSPTTLPLVFVLVGTAMNIAQLASCPHAVQHSATDFTGSFCDAGPRVKVFSCSAHCPPPPPPPTMHDAGFGTAKSRKDGIATAAVTVSVTSLPVTLAGRSAINDRPIAEPLKTLTPSTSIVNAHAHAHVHEHEHTHTHARTRTHARTYARARARRVM